MRINVAGAGAIGMLIGARLAEVGFDVRMITRTAKQAAAIRDEGILLSKGNEKKVFSVGATASSEAGIEDGLTILAMKSYDLEPFLEELNGKLGEAPLLFIQNGVSHLSLPARFRDRPIAFGTVEHGSRKTGPRSVEHTGTGPLRISPATDDFTPFHPLLTAHSPTFPVVRAEEGPGQLLMKKAVKNCLINPVTAVAGVRNGMLAEDPDLRALLGRMHAELAEAFPEIAGEVTLGEVFDLCRKTADNTSSMLADLMAGRKTEADSIMGGVIVLAQERCASLPSVTALYDLVRSLERRGDRHG
ncbi:ketopantoate reductase family protein [Bhargavaea beijingensis]|uniref:2-dehydropantoate 2-reductase n=1 Tax=Bhargavaea beijingensis TaxID=426756 RepID=A0A1G7C582_9BACL|nr:2-dehydropantoate 2-reductase [Bhargavaea beijingensis]RSK36908.1 2-dehydropantoate 2-reductase [Bhargavaea beijingensis]SDE34403.1 2-dehydropantoate 2-reductase [Bhargavaea beijingensis]